MSQQPATTAKPTPIALDMSNLSHIPVAGGAGLGLVALSALVAVTIPAIGVPLAIGAAVSAIAASVIILRRRIAGPMPTSAQAAGANTMLRLDGPESPGRKISRS